MRAGSPIKNKLWDFFLIGTWAFMQEQDQLRKETNRFYSAFIRSLVTQKRYISIQATHLQTHTHQTTDTHIQINTTHVHIYINMIFHVQKTPCIHTHTNIYTPPIAHNRRVHTHAHAVPNAYICICVCMCAYIYLYIWVCTIIYVFRGTKDMETMAGNKQTVCMTHTYQRTECCCWRYACPPDYRDYFIISFERLVRKAWSSALDGYLSCLQVLPPSHCRRLIECKRDQQADKSRFSFPAPP